MSIDFVTDQLAVGEWDDAQSPAALSAARIGFVLSLAAGVTMTEVPQVYLEVTDREPLPGPTIARAVGLIAAQIAAGRRVLVHCQMGISRSPAIALCYLHQCRGLTIAQALAEVKRARPQALPHPVLLASIRAHFAGTRPDGDVTRQWPDAPAEAWPR